MFAPLLRSLHTACVTQDLDKNANDGKLCNVVSAFFNIIIMSCETRVMVM